MRGAPGDDVDEHVEAFRPYLYAGVDVVHVTQIGAANPGTDAAGFFAFYRDQVLPRRHEL